MLWKRRVFAAELSAALLLFLAFASPAAQAQPRRERGDGPREFGPPDRPRRGFEPPTRGFETPPREPEPRTVKSGFVFIDGEYFPPPYEIRYADERVTINGHELTCKPPPRNNFGRGFGGPSRGDAGWRDAVGTISQQLSSNAAAMIFADQPLFLPDTNTTYELLSALVSVEGRSMKRNSVRDRLPDDFDKTVWDRWIENYEVSDELEQPAAVMVATYDHAQEEALSQIRARQWRDALAYPMQVSAMVLSVLAIGHLLGGRPHAGHTTRGMDDSPGLIRALNWSLFFAAVFSSFDLVWTVVMTNSNDVQELNPIGSQLIHNPRHLAGFKIAITFSCLALIWLLRRHKRAQIAAWWVCLVLTLVICRWLTVSAVLTM